MTCRDHVENEAVKDLFEYDETVAFDPKAQYVGRIGKIEEKYHVELETLPREYAQLKHLFRPEVSEKMPLRQTFDHAIDLKEGSEPPWGPVYPMSQYQLNTLKTYLDEMLAQGKLRIASHLLGHQSCLYQNPTVAYGYVWTTDNSTS